MENDYRDKNHVPMGIGISDDTNNFTVPFRVDPATNELLVTIYPVTSTVPITGDLQRDENTIPMTAGVTDDANLTFSPLIIDSRNGYLFCDVA